jgi:signal transduction histidine kinase
MNWHYTYTPYIWPSSLTVLLFITFAVYSWWRRSVPGALPFAVLMLIWSFLAIGASFELAAVDLPAKIFWVKFQYFWSGPVGVAGLCFVLVYARRERFLSRYNLLLLFIFLLLGSLLILTNDIHHWIWTGFSYSDGVLHQLRGGGYWILRAIGYLLALLNLPILIWLFIRSPQHRWPATFIFCGQIVVRAAFVLDAANINPVAPLDLVILAATFLTVMYAIALFGFRIFDPVLIGRKTVIEQMQEGMLVLDREWKIVDLNPAAERSIGLPATRLRGRDAAEFLPTHAKMRTGSNDGEATHLEISLGSGMAIRSYTLDSSPLKDHDGQTLGYLLLLHDVTEQKRAQAQLMEQQRALAMLSEREQLARELHDGIGQVLGFASLKMGATRKLIADGKLAKADDQLSHLEGIMADAHADVRENILNLRVAPSGEKPLFSMLQQYLDGFHQNYGIRVDVSIGADVDERLFAPDAQMQLFRILQEAFSNARKHAETNCVHVSFELQDSLVRIRIQDDGKGFDPAQFPTDDGHFGLRFMRERAETLGGTLRVQSAPSQGTCVEVTVPASRETGIR